MNDLTIRGTRAQQNLLEWSRRVEDCRNSGQSVRGWCEENNINPKIYYNWQKRTAFLCGKIIFDLFKTRIAAEEYAKLVLHGFRLLLHLPHGPAVYVPSKMDHAVLLQKIVIKLVLLYEPGIVRSFIVDLDRDA